MPIVKRHVFLSYSRENFADAARLRDDLMAAGERVWWDQDIHPGLDWRREVRRAMRQAYAVVACFSSQMEQRVESGMLPEVRDAIELYRARKPGSVFLIPVRFSDCEIPDLAIDSKTTLDDIQIVDLFPPSARASAVSRLIEAIRLVPFSEPGRPKDFSSDRPRDKTKLSVAGASIALVVAVCEFANWNWRWMMSAPESPSQHFTAPLPLATERTGNAAPAINNLSRSTQAPLIGIRRQATAPHLWTVTGYVVDDGGRPLPNTKLTLPELGIDALTDARGHFSITAQDQNKAHTRLIATKACYETWTTEIPSNDPGFSFVMKRTVCDPPQ